MRRTAKPFTIEVKRGPRRRDASADPFEAGGGASTGRDMRFRDADDLFRNGLREEAAAVAEENQPVAPPRRRGRPRKNPEEAPARRSVRGHADGAEPPVKRGRGRPRKVAVVADPLPFFDRWNDSADDNAPSLPVLASAVALPLDPAASQRRRAARDTSALPRGQRWKRRLPRVCW